MDLLNYIKYRIGRKLYGHADVGNKGERPCAKKMIAVRPDHMARYIFAAKIIKMAPESTKVIDAACGVGYGANYIANNAGVSLIKAIDISTEAIFFAKKYWDHEKIAWVESDVCLVDDKNIDVVVSFETIEHLDRPENALISFYNALKVGGELICSVPNESKLPFNRSDYPYHVRHFYKNEMIEILKDVGFTTIEVFGQKGRFNLDVVKELDGDFLVFRAKK